LIYPIILQKKENTCPISEGNNQSNCEIKNQDNDSGLEIEDVPKESNNENPSKQESEKNENSQSRNKKNNNNKEADIEYPDELQYQELFQRPGERRKYFQSFTRESNYTEFYDFSLDDNELKSIKEARITIYPPKKFQFNHQGNFLHFYKIAYEKELPVYFTVDSMLYAVNENINELNKIYYEEILFSYLQNFLSSVVKYGSDLIDSADGEQYKYMISHAQLYFSVGLELLSDGYHTNNYPPLIQNQIKKFIEKIKKFEIEEFYLFNNKKIINCSFLFPSEIFTKSKKLQNIHLAIKWFTAYKFFIDKKEINSIWYIGKLVVDSDNLELYEKIFKSLNFFMGQDFLTPSIVEIYKIGLKLGYNDVFDLSQEQGLDLIKKALENKNEIDLLFLNDNFYSSREMIEASRLEREFSSGLFYYQFDVEGWVKNKIIFYNSNNLRVLMNSFEITTSIHHASAFKQFIFNK